MYRNVSYVVKHCNFHADINLRESSVAEEIQGMANKGDLASDDTGHLPLHLGDLPEYIRDTNTIFTRNKS